MHHYARGPMTRHSYLARVSDVSLTLIALIGMAANSLLARGALAHHLIGPTLFTLVRLASGAATLLWLSRGQSLTRPRWNALWLFLYAAAFSYTYLVLGAAMGALLLFFAVQWTMFLGAVRRGERPTVSHFLGGLLALSGLHTLVALRLHTPAPWAVIGMLIAGSAWGLYSMPGRDRGNPLAQTTSNFVYAALLALGLGAIRFLSGVAPRPIHPLGLAEAIVSGAVTSALVYLLWYALLPRLATVVAATIQLAVPVIVALGGWLFLQEALTDRFVLAASLVLGGVALTMRRSGTTRVSSATRERSGGA